MPGCLRNSGEVCGVVSGILNEGGRGQGWIASERV